MGAVNFSSGSSKTYYNINGGKLTVRISEEDYISLKEKGIPVRHRKTKNGNDVYEKIFDGITGTIVGYEPKLNEKFNQMDIQLTLQDEDGEHIIQFPYDSRIHTMFMQRMPNIDPIRPILFGVFEGDKNDGSKVTMMYVKYVGEQETIKNAFPKDGDHKLPPLRQKKKAGQVVGWDNEAQMEFFEKEVVPVFKSKIVSGVSVSPSATPQQSDSSSKSESIDEDDDDLPF